MADGKIEEGHAIANFDNGFGADATHRRSETAIELENGELVEKVGVVAFREGTIVDDLLGVWRGDKVPIPVRRPDELARPTKRAAQLHGGAQKR